MFKKIICLFFISLFIFPLSGCWNYRGLDEMTIVSGIAIDKSPNNTNYELSYEIIDQTKPIKETGLSAKLIESEGKTLFDAARNAKKRATNKLYFGQTQIVVISEEIARTEGVAGMIDWFLRDGECRETVCVAISQEKTAREIFSIEGINQTVIANEMRAILESDAKVTASTLHIDIYKVFNTLKAQGKSLVLPAIHNTINDEEPAGEVNGLAVFKDNKLIGYLPPEESKYFLFAADEIKGGVLTVSSNEDGRDNATLEISKNTTKRSFEYKKGKLKILLETNTTVYLDEYMGSIDALDEKRIAALEKAAEEDLKNNMLHVIKKVQIDYNSDIFGFGNMIYKKDFDLWEQIKDTWEERFKTLEVEVVADIHIVNTASIKKS